MTRLVIIVFRADDITNNTEYFLDVFRPGKTLIKLRNFKSIVGLQHNSLLPILIVGLEDFSTFMFHMSFIASLYFFSFRENKLT